MLLHESKQFILVIIGQYINTKIIKLSINYIKAFHPGTEINVNSILLRPVKSQCCPRTEDRNYDMSATPSRPISVPQFQLITNLQKRGIF